MSEDLLFSFRITVIAMSVVFIALIIIAFVMVLFKNINKPSPRMISSGAEGKIEEKYPQDISTELLAAITAAVAIAIDKRFKIKKLRYRSAVPESSWKKQGVASIMASHAISKHKSEHHRV